MIIRNLEDSILTDSILSSYSTDTINDFNILSNIVTPQNQNNVTPINNSPKTYTVQAGDSYWKISKEIGIPIGELQKLNGYKDVIHPNDVLRLTPDTINEVVNIRKEREKEKK